MLSSSPSIYPTLSMFDHNDPPKWLKSSIARAGTKFCATGEGTHGLVAFLIGAIAYGILFADPDGNPPDPFVPPPRQPQFNSPVTNAESKHAFDLHEKRVTLHDNYLRATLSLAAELAQSLPTADIRELENPHVGMINVTATQIFAHMKQKYGTPSVQRLRQMAHALKVPYTPSNNQRMDEFVAGLGFQFRELAEYGNPYSSQSQVSILRENATSCRQFDDVLTNYDRDHPTADKQSFNELGKILVAEDERRRTMATTGTTGFGNAAVPAPPGANVADLRQIFDEFIAERYASAAVPAEQMPRQDDLLKANEHLTRKLAELMKQEVKTCRCGTKFTSFNPDHVTCLKCFHSDKNKAKGNKEKGRGGEKKK